MTQSTTTGTLTDNDDSSAWETLRELGFESGDWVKLSHLYPWGNRNLSFSNSSYNYKRDQLQSAFVWEDELPTNLDVHVKLSVVNIFLGSGETVDLKLRNETDGEDLVSITGITSTGMATSGWTGPYQPTTTASMITIAEQARTQPGDNSSNIVAPRAVFGVQLP